MGMEGIGHRLETRFGLCEQPPFGELLHLHCGGEQVEAGEAGSQLRMARLIIADARRDADPEFGLFQSVVLAQE